MCLFGLSKMNLPSFAREYENTTSLVDERLDEYRIFIKLEVALFSRTRDSYTFNKFQEFQEHLVLSSRIS
jgi:CHASE1-domain containing sensor protein